jgi:hypothetical protein
MDDADVLTREGGSHALRLEFMVYRVPRPCVRQLELEHRPGGQCRAAPSKENTSRGARAQAFEWMIGQRASPMAAVSRSPDSLSNRSEARRASAAPWIRPSGASTPRFTNHASNSGAGLKLRACRR